MVPLLKNKPSIRRRILCVDDEPHILKSLVLNLGRRYQVETAQGGAAALEILREMPDVTVIISDMRMPGMDGAKFLAAARKLAPYARRILLTGHADVASAVLAVNEGGIFRFLTKPCPFDQLVDAVESAMADHDEDAVERSAIRRVLRQDLLSHDLLTGLASREILLERLDQCGHAPETCGPRAKVVFVIETDVENLSCGDSKCADRLVASLSDRLQRALPAVECLARYRESTFAALVVTTDPSDSALRAVASDIVRKLQQPVVIDGVVMQSRATVGIARISTGTIDPRGALRYAELAAREGKCHGNEPVRLFSKDAIVRSEHRRETIQALRVAVAQRQLTLHYQPIIDIERNQVYSIEALARWDHVLLGPVSPSVFIPLAEETGLVAELGEWVMNRACADGRALIGSSFGRVSVNVSVAQLLDRRFMYSLNHALSTNGLEPSALELELTETVFALNFDQVCAVLSKIRLLGVSVAIDDFGSGYSSLAYLTRLPIDMVKIDKSFVKEFDHGGEAVVGAAVALAQKLKIEVIVEGVETADELARVRALGATKIQGFFFARPMPLAELSSWHAGFNGRLQDAK